MSVRDPLLDHPIPEAVPAATHHRPQAKPPKKQRKKNDWQIAAELRRQSVETYLAILRNGDDRYTVDIVKQALSAYHDAMMRGDIETRREYVDLINACGQALHRIVEFGWRDDDGPCGRSRPPKGSSRFRCIADARHWLAGQVAAPVGEVPMHGQPGRFMLVIHGCRTEVRYPGLFGFPGLSGRVIDLDKQFFSPTGYRSFAGGPAGENYYTDEGDMDVGELVTISMEQSLLWDGNGKRIDKPKLYPPPFGLTLYKGENSELEPYSRDPNDPAWQPGGYFAELSSITDDVIEDADGQTRLNL